MFQLASQYSPSAVPFPISVPMNRKSPRPVPVWSFSPAQNICFIYHPLKIRSPQLLASPLRFLTSPSLEHTMDAVTLINKPCLLCGKTTAMWCGRCQNAWYCSPDHLQSVWLSSCGSHGLRADRSPTPGLAQTPWRMHGGTDAYPHHPLSRQMSNCYGVCSIIFPRRW